MSAWRHPRLSCGAFPRENDSPAPRLRALTAFPRRERVVYPDGNPDAVTALSALLAPDTQLTAPDVQVLPADASPALEAALWAASPPRGNRDLPTPPKEREKRDSLLCDGDTVDAVLGSVFD